MAIKHTKVSSKPDGADATLVLPSDWNASHTVEPGSITEAMQVLADNATNDVSATKHGYAPKAPGNTTTFLRGDATWAVPSAAVAWTGITAGSGSATTANGDSAIVYQVAQTSADRISWRVTESAAGVSTGTPVLFQIDTAAGSTAYPFQVKVGTRLILRVRNDAGIYVDNAVYVYGASSTASPAVMIRDGTPGGQVQVSGDGLFGFTASGNDASAAPDVLLRRDAAAVLAQRDGTNAQEFRVYNTFTSATNHEFGKLEWASNVFNVGTEKGSGGGTARALAFMTDGVERGRFLADKPVLVLDEADADPGTGDLDAADSVAIYTKSNKMVFAYNNAGTITYISIPLDGSTATWTHSTVAP